MSGPVPRVKKIPPQLTPEQVAAYESMKPNKYLDNQGRPQKKTKPIKHTTPKEVKPKKLNYDITFSLDIKTMRQRPISKAFIEQLAAKLIQWVSNEKQVIIDEFLQEIGFSAETFGEFRKRCPKLEEAYQYAKMCIGNKREKCGLYNKMNAAMVMKSMPSYSKRWGKLMEWHAGLTTKSEDSESKETIVVIEKYPETKVVIKRKPITVSPEKQQKENSNE